MSNQKLLNVFHAERTISKSTQFMGTAYARNNSPIYK